MAFVLALVLLPVTARSEQWSVGLAGSGARIEAVSSGAVGEEAPTILLVGGLDGDPVSAERTRQAIGTDPGRQLRLLAIPMANPDGAALAFPPSGVAYRENPEAHALWRWIGVHAPDLVIVIGADMGLVDALSTQDVAGIGSIPATRVETEVNPFDSLPDAIPPSAAHLEIRSRLDRTPEALAGQLSAVYGHDFNQVTYLPGMALIGRLRMGATEEVRALAAPYLDQPPAIRSSLNIAGHLVFAELAERTDDPRYLELARDAADLGFDEDGNMLEAMPFHGEMSDAYFMDAPILARVGRLTGEVRYFDMASRHLEFMKALVLRPDGLYRHSPLTEAAWSRGNAFPALGLALALSDFPESHPAFPELLGAFRDLMETLLPFQDADGMWHEVIDHPGAYAELSATAMIATAMLRGIRKGWLEPGTYQSRVTRAWEAVLVRTGADGTLIDVCESTNKQSTLEAYLNRAAILGRDERGGGMMLMFATEMSGLE